MRGRLTPRMVIASGLLAVIVGAAFGILLAAVSDLRDSGRRAQRSLGELAMANQLEKLVVDLETGLRGFVLTGESRFLEPWNRARATFPQRARTLAASAADPAQRSVAKQIAEAGGSYIRDYSVPLVRAARRGEPRARSVAATAEGKRRVDALRVLFGRYERREAALAEADQDRSDSAARRAVVAAAAGLAGSVVLVLFFGGYLLRAIVLPVRRAATMAGRLAGGDLTVRMPETGRGEIGELERAFNTMARSLEANRDQLRLRAEELAASRARVVAAGDETRRRIERDLHDGAQQRLVSLGLELRAVEAKVPPELPELKRQLHDAAAGVSGVTEELREISRGIHPAILSKGGLGPALRALARRSAVPVELGVSVDRPLPERVEVAAYYVVSEALTNAAKHAGASVISVEVAADDASVRLQVHDDGVGGADPARGSGLLGLKDRVEAVGGTMEIASPPGTGTTLTVQIPVG